MVTVVPKIPEGGGGGGAPTDDRYAADLEKIKATGAFGVNVADVLKAKSGGAEDYSKDIQMSIRREFFTFMQVMEISYWSMTIGMFIGAMAVATSTGNMISFTGEGAMMTMGVLLLSAGISGILSEWKAHRSIRKCTHEKWKEGDKLYEETATGGHYKVEPEYRNRDCLTDWDCTRKSSVAPGVCALPKLNPLSRTIRSVVIPIVLVVGIALVVISFSSTDFRLAAGNLAQAIIYGIFAGNAVTLFFS